jgi:hypothetical protein
MEAMHALLQVGVAARTTQCQVELAADVADLRLSAAQETLMRNRVDPAQPIQVLVVVEVDLSWVQIT